MISLFVKQAPFSHNPGMTCLIPGVDALVRAFPAYFTIETLDGEVIAEQDFGACGPVKNFTLMQNLQKGCVTVFSTQYRYHILPNKTIVKAKNPSLPSLANKEILFLGSSKRQDWDMILRRRDFKEIFPLWFRLGMFLKPDVKGPKEGPIFSLLNDCRHIVFEDSPCKVLSSFERLFLASFSHLLVPYTHEKNGQGILLRSRKDNIPQISLPILQQSTQLIKALFVRHTEDTVYVLPKLSPEFSSGKMMNVTIFPIGSLDIEWTKKSIRRLTLHSTTSSELSFVFSPDIQRYRLSCRELKIHKTLKKGIPVSVETGQTYDFDRFEK